MKYGLVLLVTFLYFQVALAQAPTDGSAKPPVDINNAQIDDLSAHASSLATTQEVEEGADVPGPDGSTIAAAKSSDDELENVRPSKFFHAIRGVGSFGVKVVVDMPADALPFYSGILLTHIQDAMLTNRHADPDWIKNFADDNLLDLWSWVSFGGFTASSRASTIFFTSMGLMPSAEESMFRLAAGKGALTSLQSIFSYLTTPMAIGMLSSNFVTEFGKDPKIRQCMGELFGTRKSEKKEGELEVCDAAFETFIHRKLITEWMPGVLAGIPTAAVTKFQKEALHKMFARDATKTAEKVAAEKGSIRWIFRGLRLTFEAGHFAPVVGWLMSAGDIYEFMELSGVINDRLLETPWRTTIAGDDIAESKNDVENAFKMLQQSNWEWPPKVDCDHYVAPATTLTGEKSFYKISPAVCRSAQVSVPKLLYKFHERFKDWRHWLMGPADSVQQNWSTDVAHLVSRYTGAAKFYEKVLHEIADHNRSPDTYITAKGVKPLPLYLSYPNLSQDYPHGVVTEKSNVLIGSGSVRKPKFALQEAINYAKHIIAVKAGAEQMTSEEKNDQVNYSYISDQQVTELKLVVARLNAGLPQDYKLTAEERAVDPVFTAVRASALASHLLPETGSYVEQLGSKFTSLNTTQQSGVLGLIDLDQRNRLMSLAKDFVLKQSNEFIKNTTGVVQPLANPICRLAVMIDGFSVFHVGSFALSVLDINPHIFSQVDKDNHPGSMGSTVRTDSMVEFMLASMVCGPIADPSMKIKVSSYESGSRFGQLENLLVSFFTGENYFNPDDPGTIKNVELHFLETKSQSGYLPKDDNLATIVRRPGISVDYYPPRVIEDIGVDFCNSTPQARSYTDDSPDGVSGRFSPMDGTWKLKGQTYEGFLDIIKKHVRPDLLKQDGAGHLVGFADWWQNTQNQFIQLELERGRRQFLGNIKNKYYPVLLSKKTERHGITQSYDLEMGAIASINTETSFTVDLLFKTSAEIIKTFHEQQHSNREVEMNKGAITADSKTDDYEKLITDLQSSINKELSMLSRYSGRPRDVRTVTKETEDLALPQQTSVDDPNVFDSARVAGALDALNSDLSTNVTKLKDLMDKGVFPYLAHDHKVDGMIEIFQTLFVSLDDIVTETIGYCKYMSLFDLQSPFE